MNALKTLAAAATTGLILADTAFAGFVTVPEPTSLTMLALGGTALYFFHRRRNR